MENERKSNVAKVICRVIGIILSIILIPAIICCVPAFGLVLGVSSSVSQQSLVQVVGEADLPEQLLELVEKEVKQEVLIEELNAEYTESLFTDCITVEWVDGVVSEVLDALYFGRTPRVSIKPVTDKLREKLDVIVEGGFRDIYSAWVNDAPSAFFSEEFIEAFWEEIENELLGEHTEFDVETLEKLEESYDAKHGEGAFSDLLDEKLEAFESEWKKEFSEKITSELDRMSAEAEQELNEALTEAVQEPEVRKVFGLFEDLSEKRELLRVIAYGILVCAVLLLVGCFWFDTAGFVLASIPLLLGGGLCQLIGVAERYIMEIVDDVIAKEPEIAQMGGAIRDLVRGILDPAFKEVSAFGTTAMIFGVILIGLAILRSVLKKNKEVTE